MFSFRTHPFLLISGEAYRRATLPPTAGAPALAEATDEERAGSGGAGPGGFDSEGGAMGVESSRQPAVESAE